MPKQCYGGEGQQTHGGELKDKEDSLNQNFNPMIDKLYFYDFIT